jgi:hypothetical protein
MAVQPADVVNPLVETKSNRRENGLAGLDESSATTTKR